MNNKTIWLVEHKASLSESSPLNLDGSTWLTGICVLAAEDKETAMERFKAYLFERDMDLLELFDISRFDADHFTDSSSQSMQVNNAVRMMPHAMYVPKHLSILMQ